MTPSERAEKIFPIDPLHPHIGADLRSSVAAQIEEAIAEEREACANIAKELFEEKHQCSPENKLHDDNWCPECSAMEDAYDVIERKIRARSEGKT